MTFRSKLRSLLPFCLCSIPDFRGKGRLTLLLDKVLTDNLDPRSYKVKGCLNNGVLFYFDLRPWGQKFAYYYRNWESEYVDVLRKLYVGGVFLDVGSSLGLYVVCMGEAVRELGGSIVSVEPVPFNLERQKKNVAANQMNDIVIYVPHALGRERTRVRIKTDASQADNNAIIADDGDMEIVVRSLDDLANEAGWPRIGMMKIDVEGYEPMVIEGARITIKQHRPIILAEFCRERMEINGFSVNSAWQFLVTELGYLCYVISGPKGKLRLIDNPGKDENLLFVPRDTLVPAELVG